eukprot:scaffold1839_cov382-Prasinococcus_capsulatus_cf.AAC.14
MPLLSHWQLLLHPRSRGRQALEGRSPARNHPGPEGRVDVVAAPLDCAVDGRLVAGGVLDAIVVAMVTVSKGHQRPLGLWLLLLLVQVARREMAVELARRRAAGAARRSARRPACAWHARVRAAHRGVWQGQVGPYNVAVEILQLVLEESLEELPPDLRLGAPVGDVEQPLEHLAQSVSLPLGVG